MSSPIVGCIQKQPYERNFDLCDPLAFFFSYIPPFLVHLDIWTLSLFHHEILTCCRCRRCCCCCCCFQVPIVFRNQMILPTLNPPPTEMLDLRPVHINRGSAVDPRHASLLHASHPGWGGVLNSLQTQTLPSLYETDQNVLVCAPPGSGKLGCAELAVLRCLGFNAGSSSTEQRGAVRVVYVCPRVGRCRAVHARWAQTLGIGLGLRIGTLGFGGASASTPRKNGASSVLLHLRFFFFFFLGFVVGRRPIASALQQRLTRLSFFFFFFFFFVLFSPHFSPQQQHFFFFFC